MKDFRRDMFISLSNQSIKQHDMISNEHAVVDLLDENIIDITNKVFKIEADKIVNDVKKREIPRFRYDPPSQSVANTVQQLLKTTDSMSCTSSDILHPIRDFK